MPTARGQNPVLTSARRRELVYADTETFAERLIRRFAVDPLLAYCRSRRVLPGHMFGVAFSLGVFSGLFLAAGATSALYRFWAGIFLAGAMVADVAARQALPDGAVRPLKTHLLRLCAGGVIGLFLLSGGSRAAASISGSGWDWLVGLVAAIGAALQTTAFDSAKAQYLVAAGAGIPDQRESLLELGLRRRKAELNRKPMQALIWHYYSRFRRVQHWLSPDCPKSSADRFWRLNGRRMSLWTQLSPAHLFSSLSLFAVVSAFWPAAWPFFLFVFATGGNVLLIGLLAAGWKIPCGRG